MLAGGAGAVGRAFEDCGQCRATLRSCPTSAPGLGRPHLLWARLTLATSAPGAGSPRPHLHPDRAHPRPHLHRDWAAASTSALGLKSARPRLHRDSAHPYITVHAFIALRLCSVAPHRSCRADRRITAAALQQRSDDLGRISVLQIRSRTPPRPSSARAQVHTTPAASHLTPPHPTPPHPTPPLPTPPHPSPPCPKAHAPLWRRGPLWEEG